MRWDPTNHFRSSIHPCSQANAPGYNLRGPVPGYKINFWQEFRIGPTVRAGWWWRIDLTRLKVFFKSFCKSRFPHKSITIFFILKIVKNKLMELWRSWNLQNDLKNTFCEIKSERLSEPVKRRRYSHSKKAICSKVTELHKESCSFFFVGVKTSKLFLQMQSKVAALLTPHFKRCQNVWVSLYRGTLLMGNSLYRGCCTVCVEFAKYLYFSPSLLLSSLELSDKGLYA